MDNVWYVYDGSEPQGPWTLSQLRAQRAAFQIAPGTLVMHGLEGWPRPIEEVLLEFQTGPVPHHHPQSAFRFEPRPPQHDPAEETPHLTLQEQVDAWCGTLGVAYWRMCEGLPSLPKIRFRYSLRTLLIFFLFVSPILGIIANDIASTIHQRRVLAEWDGLANWQPHPWRTWRQDVIHMMVPASQKPREMATSLDQFPELRALIVHEDAILTPAQWQKVFAATHLESLSLPPTCSDSDLAGIERLSHLKGLEMLHPEAYMTIRRLRGHPRLENIRVVSEYRPNLLDAFEGDTSLCLNDLATMPNFQKPYNWSGYLDRAALQEYIELKNPKDGRPGTERFNVAILGDNRIALFEQLVAADPHLESCETMFLVFSRPEATFFLTTPLPIGKLTECPSQMNQYTRCQLTVFARVAWMADRVVLAVNADEGLTDTIREHCRLIRFARTPSWALVLDRTTSQADSIRDACAAEIGTAPVATVAGPAPDDVWLAITTSPSLREPYYMGPRLRQSRDTPIETSAPLPNEGISAHTYHVMFRVDWGGWSFCSFQPQSHNSREHTLNYIPELLPGDDVAIIRDGRVFCLGIAK